MGKVPAVNPSVTATPCQLPLAREPPACRRCQFRTKLVCNRYFPDPPGNATGWKWVHSPKPPWPLWGWFCLRQNRGDSSGWQVSTWVCTMGKVPAVNPSVTATPCQLPQAGSLWGAVWGRGCGRFGIFPQTPPANMQIASVFPTLSPLPRKKTVIGLDFKRRD